jgi:hypothetical protein
MGVEGTMSHINRYLLVVDWLEKIIELGDITSVEALNVLLAEAEWDPFEAVGAIAGVGEIFTLSGNYLSSDTVKEMIEAVPWFFPKSVQLFYRGEHDEKLSEIPLAIKMCVIHKQVFDVTIVGGASIDKWELKLRQVIMPFGGDHG